MVSNFYLPYCGAQFETKDTKRIMKIMPNSAFVKVLRSSGGEKADGLSGVCQKVELPVEVVPEKGEVVLGCFVTTLTLEERRVEGGDFCWNSVKTWSG